MRRTFLRALAFCLITASTIALPAESLFDAPDACAVALKKDVLLYVHSSSEDIAYLNTMDETTYEQVKHDASAGEIIPTTAGIVDASQSYSDFDEKRRDFFQKIGYSSSKKQAEDQLSITTAARAYTSFDRCMENLSRSTIGFAAWRRSEDPTDLVLDCQYTSPPASSFPLHIIPRLKIEATVEGGTFASNHKNSVKQSLGAGDHCAPITVLRDGVSSTLVTISASGYAPVVIKSLVGTSEPSNSATVTYTPLVRTEDTATYKQENEPPPLSNGTLDMDNKGGCSGSLPPLFCSPDGKHAATPWSFTIWPPLDGDLIDPGQDRISGAHWTTESNDTEFCSQYAVVYQSYPPPPPPGQAPPQVIEFLTKIMGKHSVWVQGRCWSRRSLWHATVRQYHMIPSASAKTAGVYRFNSGESVVFTVPEGSPSQIQFSYGNGILDIVKPGEQTKDGKIKCVKTVNFAGTTYYLYQYTA